MLKENATKLKDVYGSHATVAGILGISREHWAAVRSGKAPFTKRLERHIELLMKGLKSVRP